MSGAGTSASSTGEARVGWLEPPVRRQAVEVELARLSAGVIDPRTSVSRYRSGYVRVMVW